MVSLIYKVQWRPFVRIQAYREALLCDLASVHALFILGDFHFSVSVDSADMQLHYTHAHDNTQIC
jgi:hypothetical protein